MEHIVKYYESERGFGGEIWYRRFTDYMSALLAIEECNKNNPATAPDYYIVASYEGVDVVNNPMYDKTYKH